MVLLSLIIYVKKAPYSRQNLFFNRRSSKPLWRIDLFPSVTISQAQGSQITPRKNGKGDRRYTKQDIEKVAVIYDLIKEKGFTIKGAQSHISDKGDKTESVSFPVADKLKELKSFLIQLKQDLKNL